MYLIIKYFWKACLSVLTESVKEKFYEMVLFAQLQLITIQSKLEIWLVSIAI